MKKICLLGAIVLATVLAIVVGVAFRGSLETESLDFDNGQVTLELDSAEVRGARNGSEGGAKSAKSEMATNGFGDPKLIDTVHGTRMRDLPTERTTTETTESDLLYQSEDGSTLRVKGHRSRAKIRPRPSTPAPIESPPTVPEEKMYEKVGKPEFVEIPNEDDGRDVLPKSVQRTVKRKYEPSEYQDEEDEENVDIPSKLTSVEIKNGEKKRIRQKRDVDEDWEYIDSGIDMDLLVANVEELQKNATVV
ncbi:hypothetical protein QR680_018291 [Steinernema hermaphroditum]|uniref:Uncharacterized protein n=1 Tax=Steinernema hermaphroditum TaxID=289476 RepID=A0AA39HJV1_9BILA|nr:hypothetical protein QR680_018291 [Steinernema hermaphroditum]